MTPTPSSPSEHRPRLAVVFTSSGSVSFLFGQIDYLRRQGFDVSVISSPGPELELARQEGASVYAVPMKREISPVHDALSLWRLWRVMRKIRPDLTNVGTPKAGLLGGLAAVLAGVPHRIYSLHGLRLETTQGWIRKLLTATERMACRCAHRVHCVSPSLRARAIELGLTEPEKAVVIGPGTYRGVDTEHFRPVGDDRRVVRDLRGTLGIPEDAPVIGFVGRFTRDKGVADLYLAFASLRQSYPELRLLLLGDFESGDPIEADIRGRIEADPRVIRTGFVPDPALHYLAMDVCVLPTYREGLPGVPLEAQASGVPSVTTQATGARDSVLDGESGLIVPVGDVNALAAAIDRLLADPNLRKRMGAAGRYWVESVFRRDIVWAAIEKVYEELVLSGVASRQRGWRKLLKSLFDRAAAAGGLLLLSPLLLLTIATIRLTMGSPIFFRQRRPGFKGRPFEILKLRTMADSRDAQGNLLPDQMRLAGVGRLIRALSLDEFPQLWNVLRGDISLVGPRPLLMEYLPRYSPEQARRHDVMPGITGWAQISGRNTLSWDEKFVLDTWYVDNWGLSLDLRILLKTVWRVLRRDGISQRGCATMPEFLGAQVAAPSIEDERPEALMLEFHNS